MVLVMIENRHIKIVNGVIHMYCVQGLPSCLGLNTVDGRNGLPYVKVAMTEVGVVHIAANVDCRVIGWLLFSQNLLHDPCEFCLKHISSFICTCPK